MYTGPLQQLQMMQQAEFAQHECDPKFENLSATKPPTSGPLILNLAEGWQRLWNSFAQRRSQVAGQPGRPRVLR